jgi:hypothetical protein
MSLEGKDFFRQLEPEPPPPPPPPSPPKLPRCDGADCVERANPAWGDKGKIYCRDCAPPELKNPSLRFKESQ